MNLIQWPAPTNTGQRLFISEPAENAAELELLGWVLVDVRGLPNATDAERAESLRCWLEGLRVGSIVVDKARFAALELEAKSLGVLNTKTASDSKKNKEQELDPLEALNFKSPRAFKGTYLDGAAADAARRPAGRPRTKLKPSADSPAGKSGNHLQAVPEPEAAGDSDVD